MQNVSQTAKSSVEPQAFVGAESFMSPLASRQENLIPRAIGAVRDRFSKELLGAVAATSLPPKAQVQAFADFYFQHLYHRAPILDREDFSTGQPSILISQAICLIGSLLQHPGIHPLLEESERYYNKVKALIYTNHEADQRAVLKALCLLNFRNITPPKVVSLDCSWQWVGMATRLAHQMGLHCESTYTQLANPGNDRRIMWFLFVEDKLQTACFGRPTIIKDTDFNIRLPKLDDFEVPNLQAELFIEYTKLNVILGGIVERHCQKREMPQDEAMSVLQSLQQWINELPLQLQLYHGNNRDPYRRDVSEPLSLIANSVYRVIGSFILHITPV
ncbi:uncharacterized protein N7482_003695 [Penicillium canariense]|uniref:Xylanolytic transcriptional activator regulatory domain-containing protein n=1 Tax=Penicillium canariense TaxID=189055 RepID=A0A9W9LPE1_9EURO|nr:uncharacterized protein N7482_003695 [Penicillium canariense]KAJ5168101.1 hypothetical protein N7482_003695 [Penicillium canariense]